MMPSQSMAPEASISQQAAAMRQVSNQCGFSDVHHFAKTFKNISGQTPGSYRRYNRAG